MLLLTVISNLCLSSALVANRAALPSAAQITTGPFRVSAVATAKPARLPSAPSLHGFKSPSRRPLARSATALSATASSSASSGNGKRSTVIATSILIVLDTQFRSLFTKYSVPFPPSLAGCGALFASMIALCSLKEEWGDKVYGALNPGAMLLAKWLPVFFVPGLITLPLASGLGDVWEVR